MKSNILTVIFAGTDTSANSLAFALWELAHDMVLQEEIFEEVSFFDKSLDELELDELARSFPRLRSFFLEILRLKGPAPHLLLEPTETLDFEGESISPGTMIVVMLRSAPIEGPSEVPLGPDGETCNEFCPRRWLVPVKDSNLDGAVSCIDPSSKGTGFLAFGNGPRICPGKLFAEAEGMTTLIYIIKSFKLKVPVDHPPLRVVSRFTETFDKDMALSLEPRPQ